MKAASVVTHEIGQLGQRLILKLELRLRSHILSGHQRLPSMTWTITDGDPFVMRGDTACCDGESIEGRSLGWV